MWGECWGAAKQKSDVKQNANPKFSVQTNVLNNSSYYLSNVQVPF